MPSTVVSGAAGVATPSSQRPQPEQQALDQAWDLFRQLLPPQRLALLAPASPQTLYTPWVVIWLLLYQRIDGNATLNEAVDAFKFRFPQEALPASRHAAGRDFSSNTGAYAKARSRLDLRVATCVADHVATTLINKTPAFIGNRRCFLFDGSSVLLAPEPELQQAFPPAINQHGNSPFPVLHLAVAHEISCGLALRPEYGPMYGPNAVGELTLARRLMQRLPEHSIVMGDRNFGIFVFAWTARKQGHTALLRLTPGRFLSLRKRAREVEPGRWELTWRPSRAEQKKYPELPKDASLDGWLIEEEYEGKTGKEKLYLFTTEEGISNEQAAGAYRQRLHVETDIRDLKRALLVADLMGSSVAMVEKEVQLASVAYNLVNQTRRLAAARAGLEPRRLSFKGVWSLVKTVGLKLMCSVTTEGWQQEFDRVLDAAAQRKLPDRKKRREYLRQVYNRRHRYPLRKRQHPPKPPLQDNPPN